MNDGTERPETDEIPQPEGESPRPEAAPQIAPQTDPHTWQPGATMPPAAPPVDPGIPPRTADQPEPGVPGPRAEETQERGRASSGCGLLLAAALISFVVAAFAGLAGGFLGASHAGGGLFTGARPSGSVTVVPSETDEPVAAATLAALPSVVNIDVRAGGGRQDDSLPEDHPSTPSIGNGSGVAFRAAEGGGTYIITNNHVVENATRITVRGSEGRSMEAEIVGTDPESDIAVVRVNREIPVVEVTDSGELVVGQMVIAIGSPFGLEHSVTSGVISALGRSLPQFPGAGAGTHPLVDVIQTDAAINPGNSGGALVDRQGRLVGINTAIFTDTGASGGIGFAVPSNTAVRVAEQIIDGGEVTHPFIGVVGQSVTPELADAENLEVEEGAYVADFAEDSGAQAAGVEIGDVIIAVDDEPVRSMDDLILLVRRKQVGDEIQLRVQRGSETLDFQATVGDKPAELDLPQERSEPETP